MANRKPVVEGHNKTIAPGTKIPLTALFDWTDRDGARDIVSFTVKDLKGGGYFTRDNKPQADGKSFDIPAAEIGRWAYVAGNNGTEDTITLKAIDKAKAYDSDTARVSSALPNARPDVDGHDMSAAPGTEIPLSSLFEWDDRDGPRDIVSFKVHDLKGGGYLLRDNKAQMDGKSFDIPAAEIDRWEYKVGAKGSADTISLTATDKAGTSDSDSARVLAASADGPIQLVSPVGGNSAWRVGQAPGGSFSHDGDLYHGWDFSLANGTNEFGANVYAVAPGIVKWVVEYVRDGDADQMTRDFSWGPPGGLGNVVTLEHKVNGVTFYSSYFHLKYESVPVTVGQTVAAGQKIGEIGNTGAREGTHLHLNLGFSLGPFTNGGGASFGDYQIAEGPQSQNLLSRFDFIDSPRADKELHTGTQFSSTTGAQQSARIADVNGSAPAASVGEATTSWEGVLDLPNNALLFPPVAQSALALSADVFADNVESAGADLLMRFDPLPEGWYLP